MLQTSWLLQFLKANRAKTLANRKHKNKQFYPRVQITSISEVLIKTIGNWLKEQDIPLSIMQDKKSLTYKGETKIHYGHRFQISGEKNLEKWMQLIGFKNNRHLNKYKKYKESGSTGI